VQINETAKYLASFLLKNKAMASFIQKRFSFLFKTRIYCTFTHSLMKCAINMPLQKTRDRLIDVARQLFAKMGVENTTMNDIAVASGRGRRTLYTYFKNKDDLYMAVVKSELDILANNMRLVAEKNISPDKKLIEIIYTRLEAVKEVVYRNGTLRANFFRDIWKVENIRKQFDAKEILLFRSVLAEGVAKGTFEIEDINLASTIVHYCVKGIEVPFIRGQIGRSLPPEVRRKYVSEIILRAVGCKK
jgi:AcrR family transcriptional regulator